MTASAGQYDYVIVGAGSAGCVVAARLSEDPRVSVLLIEAGGSDRDPYISIPLAWGRLFVRRYHDWGYSTLPEPHLNDRVLDCARGKVIGGSSSTNAMAYARGHSSDYDEWARMGLAGWDYETLLPYFRKSETWQDGAGRYRGGEGPLTTVKSGLSDPVVDAWFAAGARLGYPFSDDSNGAQQEGFAIPQWTIRRGRRCSAARAYLRPALRRPNLSLWSTTHTTRIQFEGKRAVGVEYQRSGRQGSVRARREVILCAGAINSPHLLMLSGVGPRDHLRDNGIEARIDLPGVGQNLQDHMSAPLEYARKDHGTFQRSLRYDRFLWMLAQGQLFGSGGTTGLPMGVVAFLRSSYAGPATDLALLFRASMPNPRQHFPGTDPGPDGIGYRLALTKPRSKGWVRLASADPLAAPAIANNFLSDPHDLLVAREGFRMIRKINDDPQVSAIVGEEKLPGPAAQSDDQIDAHIRASATTVHHPVGTCKMAADDDEMGVLDNQLRVRGASGLRVIDASIMPVIVSGATNGPTIMLAERGADIVKSSTTSA